MSDETQGKCFVRCINYRRLWFDVNNNTPGFETAPNTGSVLRVSIGCSKDFPLQSMKDFWARLFIGENYLAHFKLITVQNWVTVWEAITLCRESEFDGDPSVAKKAFHLLEFSSEGI